MDAWCNVTGDSNLFHVLFSVPSKSDFKGISKQKVVIFKQKLIIFLKLNCYVYIPIDTRSDHLNSEGGEIFFIHYYLLF